MTQNSQLLAHLQKGRRLTARQARDLYGCDRLAARVNDLINQGHPIKSRLIVVQNRSGRDVRIAQYFIDRTAQQGQLFYTVPHARGIGRG